MLSNNLFHGRTEHPASHAHAPTQPLGQHRPRTRTAVTMLRHATGTSRAAPLAAQPVTRSVGGFRLTFAGLAKKQQSTLRNFAPSTERQRLGPSLTFTSTTLGELLAPPQCSMPVVSLGGPLGVEMSQSGVSTTTQAWLTTAIEAPSFQPCRQGPSGRQGAPQRPSGRSQPTMEVVTSIDSVLPVSRSQRNASRKTR